MEPEDIKRLHSIAFALESVKVTLHDDVSINVSGIKIEGRGGEILNIPRWAAQILESKGHAKVEEKDMVVEMKQTLVKENVQGDFELSTLEPYFYIRLRSHMKRLSGRDADRVSSMLNTLVRKRQGKVVRLANSAALSLDLEKKLAVEEKILYENIHTISTNFTKSILEGMSRDDS